MSSPRRSKGSLLPAKDHAAVLRGYRSLLPVHAAVQPHLGGVLDDALAHPGSLVRAQVAWALMRESGVSPRTSLEAAVAIEYFHTASLILDDLPCMDDATERRGHACPHVTWGESAAVLGALALINHAYGLLWSAIGPLPSARRRRAARLVSECLGVEGVLDGQARDLHFAESPRTEASVLEVASGKTVPLIRLTLVLPALVGGASASELRRLERLSLAWGLAYQALDDFRDRLLSGAEAGKSTNRDATLVRPNLVAASSSAAALERLEGFLAEADALVGALTERGRRRDVLARLHARLRQEHRAIEARLRLPACA